MIPLVLHQGFEVFEHLPKEGDVATKSNGVVMTVVKLRFAENQTAAICEGNDGREYITYVKNVRGKVQDLRKDTADYDSEYWKITHCPPDLYRIASELKVNNVTQRLGLVLERLCTMAKQAQDQLKRGNDHDR